MGHIFSFGINNPKVIKYPFISLVASGGHTCIYKVESATNVKKLNETTDDAIGEALDKIGRTLGMEYPGGVSIDKCYSSTKSNIKMPDHHKASDNFSFSGLKNHILNIINVNNMKKIGIDKVAIGSSALK
jgi:N6-L-threonylcarbamoyladenine synthase